MNYILYNPFASNGKGLEQSKKVLKYIDGEKSEFVDFTAVDYRTAFSFLEPEDRLIICGGDGTLNHLINDCEGRAPENDVWLFPVGTGNDFLLDIGYKPPCAPVLISRYLQNLPWVEINDKKYYFIDNVAFGIDGWVCEEADRIKARNPAAKINYTTIAIRGILGAYKSCSAKAWVDGKEYSFDRVWMAPAMNGRYFGGGMMVTPQQDRLDPENTLTLMLYQNANRFDITTGFPQIFGGKHINDPRAVFIKGHEIIVEYSEPRAVQIDGEVISGVLRYRAVKN